MQDVAIDARFPAPLDHVHARVPGRQRFLRRSGGERQHKNLTETYFRVDGVEWTSGQNLLNKWVSMK